MSYGLYDTDGTIRTTVVSGTESDPLQAPDGSINIVLDNSTYFGVYHPCGAFRVNSGTGDSVYDPSGAFYINHILGSHSANIPLPLDTIGMPSVAAAFGTKPLTKAWAGQKLFQLYDFANTGTPFELHAEGLNAPIQTFADFLGVDPFSGVGGALINIAYDQSGNGRDFLAPGTADQVSFKPDLWLIHGKMYYFGGGVLMQDVNLTGAYLTLSNDVQLDLHNHAFFALHKPYSTTNSSISAGEQQNIIFNPGDTQNGYWSWATSGNATDPSNSSLIDTVVFSDAWVGPTVPLLNISKSVMSILASSEDVKIGTNENLISNGGPLTQGGSPATGGFVGGKFPFDNGGYYGGRLEALIICDANPSDEIASNIRRSLYRFGQITDNTQNPQRINILVSGASLDEGQGGDATNLYEENHNGGGYGWAENLADRHAAQPLCWHNTAVSGATLTDDYNNYIAGAHLCYDPGAKRNIAIVGNSAIGNDVFQGVNAVTAYATFVNLVTAVKNDGWDIVGTYLFISDVGSVEAAYNTLVRAGAASLGLVIVADNVSVSAENVHPDGHFKVEGYMQVADALDPVFSSWLA